MTNKTNGRVKALAAMAMLTALAVAADIFLRIPNIGGFLTYEPKDVILTIGAFIFGPIPGLIMSLAVCFVEMVTVSTTGPIGLLMNFLGDLSPQKDHFEGDHRSGRRVGFHDRGHAAVELHHDADFHGRSA